VTTLGAFGQPVNTTASAATQTAANALIQNVCPRRIYDLCPRKSGGTKSTDAVA
jgi:hypothetical protein